MWCSSNILMRSILYDPFRYSIKYHNLSLTKVIPSSTFLFSNSHRKEEKRSDRDRPEVKWKRMVRGPQNETRDFTSSQIGS